MGVFPFLLVQNPEMIFGSKRNKGTTGEEL